MEKLNLKKLNLFEEYGADETLEKEGVKISLILNSKSDDMVHFWCRRNGGRNTYAIKKAIAEESMEYISKLKERSLSPEEINQIEVKAFVKTILVKWENVKTCVGVAEDGSKIMEDVKYTEENAVQLLLGFPEIFITLQAQSALKVNYQQVDDLGNF